MFKTQHSQINQKDFERLADLFSNTPNTVDMISSYNQKPLDEKPCHLTKFIIEN